MTTGKAVEPVTCSVKVAGTFAGESGATWEFAGKCYFVVDQTGFTVRKKRMFGSGYRSASARWEQVEQVQNEIEKKRLLRISTSGPMADRMKMKVQILDGDAVELGKRLFSGLGLKAAPEKGTTVVFRDNTRLAMPSECTGCFASTPEDRIPLTVFSIPSLSSGAKALKAASILIGLAKGGLVGAVGGAHLGDRLKTARAVAVHSLPICTECRKKLTPNDGERLSEPCEELFNDKGITNVFLSIKITQGCAVLSLLNAAFARALSDANPGRTYTTVESCLASKPGESPEPHTPSAVQCLPSVHPQKIREYEGWYGRTITPLEAAIIDAWFTKVGTKQQSLSSHPDVPRRKLANARSTYASVTDSELVLGLQDSTVFGSAKQGALFTTEHIYWKSIGTSKAECVAYHDIAPSSVNFTFSFTKKHIVLSREHRLELGAMNDERPLAALCSFIVDASTFANIAR